MFEKIATKKRYKCICD